MAQSTIGTNTMLPRATGTTGPSLPGLVNSSPYWGSVPRGEANSQEINLTLSDAINLALRQNLGALLASAGDEAARGARWEALSALLPHVDSETHFGAVQQNLRAMVGLRLPGVPPVVGPFGVFDARVFVTQRVFDWKTFEENRAAAAQEKAAQYTYSDARELVVLAVSATYLECIADQSRVETALAQRHTAQTLYQQADDQQTAGLAAQIDVLRAQVQLQSQQQQLIVAQNDLAKNELLLGRVIGLPPLQKFQLTTLVAYAPLAGISLNQALASAYANRADYKSAQSRERSAEFSRGAAVAGYFPTVDAEANYGGIGTNPGSVFGTVNASVSLRIPIFEGGKTHGEILEADATYKAAREELQNLHAQISEEIQADFLDLQAASDQVHVATSQMNLADQALEQAKDRFASGVTDNVEVVEAQQAVTTANETYISSLYSYNVAKISLARAMGTAETDAQTFLEGK